MSETAQDFEGTRKNFISNLSKDLGEQGLYEAIVVYKSRVNKLSDYEGLELLKRRQDTCAHISAFDSISETQLVEMRRFHNESVQPLVLRFLDSGIKGLDEWEYDHERSRPRRDTVEAAPASDMETPCLISDEQGVRFYRAFYRYQYACNIFPRLNYNEEGLKGEMRSNETKRDEILDFLKECTPEERRDLKKVNDWVTGQYRKLISDAWKAWKMSPNKGVKPALMKDHHLRMVLVMRGLNFLQSCLREKFDVQKMKEVEDRFYKAGGLWGAPCMGFLDDAYEYLPLSMEWNVETY